MFSLRTPENSHASTRSRREWLRVGGVGAAGLCLPGLNLPDLWANQAGFGSTSTLPGWGRARSCIVCFLFGAPAHQDLWDLKPKAPAEVRGEFNPIATTVPGWEIGEHLPLTAAEAHHLALIRSVQHPDNTHTVAMHYMLTGQRHAQPETNPQNQPTDFPTFGALMEYLRRGPELLPRGISLNAPANQVSANNHIFPGFFAGWLGSRFDPLFVAQDPSQADFQPFPVGQPAEQARLVARRTLLDQVDSRRQELEQMASSGQFPAEYARAFRLVSSQAARQAFDLAAEPAGLRDRYGPSAFGQGLLLARRLVEAGVSLVTVNWARDDAYWDTHANNFRDLREKLLPPFDRAFAALLGDLRERGLLEETLVICLGEFGRTPKINSNAGRDHWAACNSVVLAGGGVQGGQVVGASDRQAAFPVADPVTPEDLAATLYHALGVDPGREILDPLGRPHRLCHGQPLTRLF